MPAKTQSAQEELEAYHQTYRYLFRNILSKRGLPPEKQRQILTQIQNFQQNKIQDVDSYLEYIPTFAKALGVRADQLGAYIGANFLKALHQVQSQMAQAAKEASRIAEDPSVKRSILKEIALSIGSVIEPPGRLVAQERGLLALSIGEELILSKTATEEAAKSPSTTVTGKIASSKGTTQVKEPSILEEVVRTLGSALSNTEKLVVPAFPKAMREEMEKSQLSLPSSTSKAGEASGPVQEPSILEEIVRTLGNALSNTEKLVVPAFPKAMQDQIASATESFATPTPAPAFVPIDLSFGQYLKAMQKVQVFQAKKDGPGYQRWLKETPVAVRLLLSLRKAETKASRGESIDWQNIYQEATQNLDATPEQAEELHTRIRKYARMQRLQSQFIAHVKKQPPVLLQAMQKLWPQIRLILEDDDTMEGRMKQLQFPMLQITNPKVKEAVTRLVTPLFKKMDEIAKS